MTAVGLPSDILTPYIVNMPSTKDVYPWFSFLFLLVFFFPV